jgi:amidase
MKRNLLLAALAATGVALASAVVPSVVAQASHHDESFQVWEKTIRELQAALAATETTSRELVERYVERVEAYDVEGPRLNAVRHLNRRASQIAHRLDRDRKHDRGGGPLFGIPIMLKDNIDTADQPTTAGSLALEGSMPRNDAFITRKLREAGAAILQG